MTASVETAQEVTAEEVAALFAEVMCEWGHDERLDPAEAEAVAACVREFYEAVA